MISAIKGFLSQLVDPVDKGRAGDGKALQVATAALLVEMMRTDNHIAAEESALIEKTLREQFSLEAGELGDLLKLADAEARLARWTFRPNGTEGFAKAEVTVGGISTANLSSQTMMAKACRDCMRSAKPWTSPGGWAAIIFNGLGPADTRRVRPFRKNHRTIVMPDVIRHPRAIAELLGDGPRIRSGVTRMMERQFYLHRRQ